MPDTPEMPALTEAQIVEAVREADLDWHHGWTLDETEANRFIQLARAIEAALNAQWSERLAAAVKDERQACAMEVWMTLQLALADDADDKGLDGWMREAEDAIRARSTSPEQEDA